MDNYLTKTSKQFENLEEFNLSSDDMKNIVKHLPEYLFTKLMAQAVKPDINHLKICECAKPYLEEATKQAVKNNSNLYYSRKLDENDDTKSIYNKYVSDAYEKVRWQIIAKRMEDENKLCAIEEQEIFKTLILFSKKYDLNDPRIFVIVDALTHQMLSAHRMQLYSNEHGVLNIWYDKNDNKRMSMNPVEELKLKYDEARINAIAILDRIMEGSKVNILSSVKINDIDDIFTDTINEGEYTQID